MTDAPRPPAFRSARLLALSLGLSIAGFSHSAQAATKTWDGDSTVDSNWNTGANWDANTAPVANSSLVFDQNVRLAAANNFAAATQFNGITFATSAGAFTLSGNSITLGGDIADNSLNAETISLPLVLSATRSVDVASRMGSLTLGGVISGNTFGITKTGSGVLTLTGANTFTGGVTINGGVISFSADGTGTAQQLGSGAAGAASVTLNGGALRSTASTQLSTNRGVTLGASGGTIDVSNAGTLTYNGVISGGANTFTKTGVGTLALGGVSTYTGNTYLNQGTLKLDFTGLVGTTSNIISSSSKLVLGGAPTTVNFAGNTGVGVTLNMTSKSGANSTQTFNGLQLGYGTATGGGALATISTTQTASGNNLLNLGAITHNAGGTVNFSFAGALSGSNAITTTTGNDGSTGILGGWATYGGTSYAANDGSGNIIAYTGYTPIATAATIANAAASNVQVQTTGAVALSVANGITDINTLSLSTAATGATTVTMGATGTLRLGANGGLMVATGGGSLTIGSAANNGTLTAGGAPNTVGEITLNNASVLSKITDNGTGAVTVTINGGNLSGANTYSGGTYIQTGFTQTGNLAAFGTGAVTVMQGAQVYANLAGTYLNDFYVAGNGNGDGAVRLDINSVLSGKITLIADARISARNRNGTLSGQITGDYAFELGSNILNGSMTLSNASVTNFNNWTGNTSINTLVILNSNTGDLIPDGSGKGNVNITSSNILELNGKTETINGLTGGGSVRNNANGTNVTFTLGNNDATSSYGGTIVDHTSGTGTVALTKIGNGTQTLTNANTYSGTTKINAGTLLLSGAGSIANSTAINVASGAKFDVSGVTGGNYTIASGQTLNGKGTVVGNTTIAGNLAPGNSPGVLTFTAALTLSGTATMEINNTGTVRGTDYDGVDAGGLLTYGGALSLTMTSLITAGTYDLFDFGSVTGNFSSVAFAGGIYAGTFTYNSGNGTWNATDTNGSGQSFSYSLASGDLNVVPEPSTYALLGVGLVIVVTFRRRLARCRE